MISLSADGKSEGPKSTSMSLVVHAAFHEARGCRPIGSCDPDTACADGTLVFGTLTIGRSGTVTTFGFGKRLSASGENGNG